MLLERGQARCFPGNRRRRMSRCRVRAARACCSGASLPPPDARRAQPSGAMAKSPPRRHVKMPPSCLERPLGQPQGQGLGRARTKPWPQSARAPAARATPPPARALPSRSAWPSAPTPTEPPFLEQIRVLDQRSSALFAGEIVHRRPVVSPTRPQMALDAVAKALRRRIFTGKSGKCLGRAHQISRTPAA